MSMMKEFKDFAMKGNVMDMAVGIIIGGAFKTIITSLVGGVIMPIAGKFMGGVDFSQLFINLTNNGYATLAEAEKAGAAVIKYGAFFQTVIDFIILAFVIFMMVKGLNAAKKKEEAAPAAPPAPSKEEVLLTEIRDALRAK